MIMVKYQRYSVLILLLAGLFDFTANVLAQSTILTFDDISSIDYPPVPNGYGGLLWSNVLCLDGVNWQPSGPQNYTPGVVSPNNVVLNGYAEPAEISSLSPFYIKSGYFTAVTVEPVQLQVQGYIGGVAVFDNTYSLVTSHPTLVSFDAPAVDLVRFSTSCAVWRDNGFYFRDWFALDNLNVTLIPEPSGYMLFVSSLGMLAISLRKRTK